MHSDYLQTDRGDRAKAAAAALAVHMLLGAVLLTGLALHFDSEHETGLVTFDVPPPPAPPPIEKRPDTPAKGDPARAGKTATPSPIVVPVTKVQVDQTVVAASVAGQGAASSSGGSTDGTGSGAGGSGDGIGGGAGMVGARLLTGALTRRDYRQIADLGSSRGAAELLLLVNKLGRVERCQMIRSSGNSSVDGALCKLLADRARFAPAHSADGTLYYQDVHYFPRWGR